MGFINVLKKVGSVFSKVDNVLQEVSPFMPIAGLTLPGVVVGKIADVFSGTHAVTQGIEAVSATLGNKSLSGEQKLAAAVPQVAGLVMATPFMSDKVVRDVPAFEKAIELYIQASVALQNAVEQLTPDQMNVRVQQAQMIQAKMQGNMPVQNAVVTAKGGSGILN